MNKIHGVSALFVQSNGCYSDLDAWDEERDARKYKGPNRVIAHPPCQRWGKMCKVNHARWGGEHNKLGNDGGCFESALDSVSKFGGVLEHPAQTYAWEAHGLPKPVRGKWTRAFNVWTRNGGGWVCEVWQSAYGHKANKATWLYYVGMDIPFDLDWSRPRGTHQVGFQDKRGKARNKPTLSKKDANATPIQFRDMLIRLALWDGDE